MSFLAAPPPIVHRLPANGQGRDFVVGDLHGCRVALDVLLQEAGFDPQRDRLFSVGDLIDRGPDSKGCLALLDQPWFHAVRGNHEQLLIDSIRSIGPETTESTEQIELWLINGGDWAEAGIASRQPWLWKIAERLDQLPHLLIVDEGGIAFTCCMPNCGRACLIIGDPVDRHPHG